MTTKYERTGEIVLMSLETSGKVENFIESLNLPYNVSIVLLECEGDCHQFFEGFYMRNKYVIDDLLDYREYKIEKSTKTLDIFMKECYYDIRIAFQSTFYQSFSTDDMGKIGQAIRTGVTSLEELFAGFQENPNKNILKNIL